MHYRVEWWLPVAAEPGEWGGRWRLIDDAHVALRVALEAFAEGPALGLVMLSLSDDGGREIGSVAADEHELREWDPSRDQLPQARRDAKILPPPGREDIGTAALLGCQEALRPARDCGLLHEVVVGAILDIVQQALDGIGPAVEVAAAINREVDCATRSQAS